MAGKTQPKAVGTGGGAVPDTVDWEMLAGMLPDADETSADRIVLAVLEAQTPEEMNASTNVEGFRNLNGHILRISNPRKAPSQFANEGRAVFVIVDAVDLDNGKSLVVTTSADQPVAMIVKSHVSDWLPADFRVKVSEKQTKAGFHPINLEYLGRPFEG